MEIVLPDYLTKDDLLKNSSYIKYFLNSINEKDQITLDNLNAFFCKKHWYKFYLLDEFILRGFNLPLSIKYLYPYEENVSSYIEVYKEGSIYKNLDLKSFGLESLHNFNITSDLFFDKIPLERFKYFNPKLDLKKFSRTLQSLGFKIISLEVVQSENTTPPVEVKPKDSLSKINNKANEVKKEKASSINEKTENILGNITTTPEILEKYILNRSRDIKIQELKELGSNVLDLIKNHQRIYLKNKDIASHIHFLNIKLEENQRLEVLFKSNKTFDKKDLFDYFKDNFDNLLKRNKIRNLLYEMSKKDNTIYNQSKSTANPQWVLTTNKIGLDRE